MGTLLMSHRIVKIELKQEYQEKTGTHLLNIKGYTKDDQIEVYLFFEGEPNIVWPEK